MAADLRVEYIVEDDTHEELRVRFNDSGVVLTQDMNYVELSNDMAEVLVGLLLDNLGGKK